MVEQQTFTQAVIDKAQKEKPWVYRKGKKYRVVPRTSDHGKYELAGKWVGVPVVENCIDYRTGEECLGFKFSGQCYHSARLLIHLAQQEAKRSGNKENNVLVFRVTRGAEAVAGS